jgi:hypothetical protein
MAKDDDLRRLGSISVSRSSGLYRLTIDGVLWASVEWSQRRGAWCIEDGVGQCFAHVEHIHGEDVDAERALRLARRMIRDGRMPTPEQSQARLREKQTPAKENQPTPALADLLVLVRK